MTVRTIPACVSYYETGDEACDGDPQGATDAERKVCDWCTACIAFQAHLENTGKAQSDYLQILEEPVVDDGGSPVLDEAGEPVFREVGRARDGGQAFYDFCMGLAQKRETGPLPLVQPSKRRKRQERSTPRERGELRRRVRRGPYIGAARRRELMLERGEAIFEDLIKRIGPERRSRDCAAPAVGQIYVLRTDTPASHISYRRLTAYCRTGKKRDRPIMRLRPRREGTFDVHFPVGVEALAKALGSKGLAKVEMPEPFELGCYQSRIKRVDEDGMKAVLRAVVALVRKGKIVLPAVQIGKG